MFFAEEQMRVKMVLGHRDVGLMPELLISPDLAANEAYTS
jgi:hypothetical protein